MARRGITGVGGMYKELNADDKFAAYTGVDIEVDKDSVYAAGNQNGLTLDISNEWGTQDQADNIAEDVIGFAYKPFTVTGAHLDPAAELSDGLNMSHHYGGIYKISRTFNKMAVADVAAPKDTETDHEYMYKSQSERILERKFSAINTTFRMQTGLIEARVEKKSNSETKEFGWLLDGDSWEVFGKGGKTIFKVTEDGAEVTGVIRATSGVIAGFNIGGVREDGRTINAIWKDVQSLDIDDGVTSGVYVGPDGIRIGKNFKVDSSGNVTASNINAANITLTGNITLKDSKGSGTIGANALRTGGVGGNNYTSATTSGGTRPALFQTSKLDCKSLVVSNSKMSLGGYANIGVVSANSAKFVLGF